MIVVLRPVFPPPSQPFSITAIYNAINEADGVADVANVDIFVQTGGIYSDFFMNLDEYMSPDGTHIRMPHDVIWEVRLVGDDIQGVILK